MDQPTQIANPCMPLGQFFSFLARKNLSIPAVRFQMRLYPDGYQPQQQIYLVGLFAGLVALGTFRPYLVNQRIKAILTIQTVSD